MVTDCDSAAWGRWLPGKRAGLERLGMAAAVATLALSAAPGALAQTPWPTKPVTIVVPFAPGGGTDIGTRIVAQKLSQLWGQSVLVDNKGGASGNVGLEAVSRARADGYTLLTGNVGTQSINPTLYKKLSYNPDTSFVPIGQFAELPFVLAATSSLPAKDARELVALAKAKPDSLNYASSGIGGSPHLSAETFKVATGIKMTHVPYKGGGAAMTALIAGNVHLIFSSVLETSAFVKSGKLKALAIASNKRVSALPDVQQQLLAQGAVAVGGTTADSVQLIANDRKRYARIIVDNQITAD